MSPADAPVGPLDVATLGVIARRATTHEIVDGWSFQPDSISPRRLELRIDAEQYPETVDAVRLDVRWFEGGDYAIHYVESGYHDRWQCRWDRHPKPEAPRAHFHSPPDAATDVEGTNVDDSHPLGVLFAVLDRVEDRLMDIHDN